MPAQVVNPPKKKEKVLCFRCKNTCHLAEDCTVVLCLYCDRATHVSQSCHLLSAPKPVATMYGLANDTLLFFDTPKSEDLRVHNESGKVGRIRVTGGMMSVAEITKELEWLVQGDHQWDVSILSSNSFQVIFPTKQDFVRLRKIGMIKVGEKERTLHFEECTNEDIQKYDLVDLWVRVRGCTDELRRDYLALFAVGSLIGKTLEVDMAFTRANKEARIKVSCAEPLAIPRRIDHTYDGVGYMFRFSVENDDEEDEIMDDADQDDGHDGDDNNKGKKTDDKTTRPAKNLRQDLETEKGADPPAASDNPPAAGSGHKQQQLAFKFGTLDFQSLNDDCQFRTPLSLPSKKWGDRVEEEDDSLPSPIARSAPVLTENDARSEERNFVAKVSALFSGAEGYAVTPLACKSQRVRSPVVSRPQVQDGCQVLPGFSACTAEGSPRSDRSPSLPRSCSPTHLLSSPQQEAVEGTGAGVFCSSAELQHTPGGSPSYADQGVIERGTGVFLGGRYSMEEVIAFGGISEPEQKEGRSSARLRANKDADATILERAQRRASERDSFLSGTKSITKFSIASIPKDTVIARASKLGVSLGSSSSQVDASISRINDIDLDRTLIMLKRNEDKQKLSVESVGCSILNKALEMSTDLAEEEHSGSPGHKDLDSPVLAKKRVYAKKKKEVSIVRRSIRIQLNSNRK